MEVFCMPRPFKVPAYQLHRQTGQARVKIAGRDHYLGPHGSEESKLRYEELVRKLLTDREKADLARRVEISSSLTIAELVAAYKRFARSYYVKNCRPTNEFGNVALALEPVWRRHGYEFVTQFGPKALKAIREGWVAAGLVRTQVNKRVERVRRMFAWGVAEELIPVEVLQALRTVKGLTRGRTEAREGEKVRPVPDAAVDAIRPHVSRQVWAMVELQRLTGARPGEVVIMRTCDLVTTGKVWEYRPASHKSEHRERDRVIYIGPQAQEVLRPWLRPELEAYLFQPRESEAARLAAIRAARKSKVQPSQRCRKRARPRKVPGERYTTVSYRRAIERACNRAFPHPTLAGPLESQLDANQAAELRGWRKAHRWHPHQLRHSAATRLRREFGLDTARAVLGHSSPVVTEIYAEMDRAKAIEAMGKIG
jgi:integrase